MQGGDEYDTTRLFDPSQDHSLSEIITDLGRGLRPDGSDEQIDDWFLRETTFRNLVNWAKDSGLFYDSLRPLNAGGKEHDVTPDRASDSWLKFTKPSQSEFSVEFDPENIKYGLNPFELFVDNPISYLERLVLQNEVFGDQITFVGVGGPEQSPRMIIYCKLSSEATTFLLEHSRKS